MMSKDEVKKEYKESEGDPHHKAKRKELHQEIMEGAQMEAVKGADVVVTNPDHLAVALRYDREKEQAPRGAGQGRGCSRPRRSASWPRRPACRYAQRAAWPTRSSGWRSAQEIPEELYDAVAEVLNFVYQLEPGSRGARAWPRGAKSVLGLAGREPKTPTWRSPSSTTRRRTTAPRVVAKGMRLKAEKIREIAKQYGVPLMKNTTLAGALYRVDVGQEIPEELYDAVAEVLNFVYALQQEQVEEVALFQAVSDSWLRRSDNQPPAPHVALGRPAERPREAGRPRAARPEERPQEGRPEEPGAGLRRAARLHRAGPLGRGAAAADAGAPEGHDADVEGFIDRPFLCSVAERIEAECPGRRRAEPFVDARRARAARSAQGPAPARGPDARAGRPT